MIDCLRKSNRSTEAVQMLQRCIKIEPDFTAAYLELVKIYGGNEAGKLLRRIVSINSRNADLRLQYANWLFQRSKFFDKN
jgi:Tfp pilus assembly protein PilF